MDNRDYYTTLVESISATSKTYIGEAVLGTLESQASWRLMEVSETSAVTRIRYADGDASFCHVWNSRAGYTYS